MKALSETLRALERKNKHVFIGTKGTRLKSVKSPMQTVFKRSGVQKARFHDFRGSWASWASEDGVDAFTIKEIGGWRDLTTVLRYVHRNKIDLHIAMNRFGGVSKCRNITENANIVEMNRKLGGT
jgi:integrase